MSERTDKQLFRAISEGGAATGFDEAIPPHNTVMIEKDISKYSSYYSGTFKNGDKDKNGWIKYKGKVFKRDKSISVRFEEMTINLKDDRAEVEFIQHYRSGKCSDNGYKKLTMVNNGGWKIESESWRDLKGLASKPVHKNSCDFAFKKISVAAERYYPYGTMSRVYAN